MSLSISRHSWLKVAACALALAQLWGCVSTQRTEIAIDDDEATAELAELFEDFESEPEPELVDGVAETSLSPVAGLIDDDYDPLDDIAASAPVPELPQIEQTSVTGDITWHMITGGTQGNLFTGVIKTRFKEPVAVAARGEYIYVVDQGLDTLFRVDQTSWHVETLLDLRTEVKGRVADIYVAKDLSFYLTDTEGARVLQYDAEGDRVHVYRNHFNLVQPVAIAALGNGDIVVADGHYDHLLHFNRSGELIATYGARGAGVAEFTNITTMAQGPDGYYVGSKVGRKMQVVGTNGNYLYAFEEGGVIFPSAIVINNENRSYVADQMDGRIKVFERGVLVSEFGRFGSAPGQFKRISDLWLEEGTLYVADSLNGRIQMARIFDKVSPSLTNASTR